MSKFLFNILVLSLLFVFTVNTSFAQDAVAEEETEEPKLTFSGSVDTYFRTNLLISYMLIGMYLIM